MPAAPLGLLLAGLLAVALSPALAQTPQDALFDDSAVAAVSLTMDPVDWSRAAAQLSREHLLSRGVLLERQCVGEHRCALTRRSQPPAHQTQPRCELREVRQGAETSRLPFLVLKANNRDPSNLREWISMALFRNMGIPAPREAPARVTINGALLGFYMIVEHVDETFLAGNFGENGGRLYKWRNRTNYEFDDLGPDPANYEPLLQFNRNRARATGATLPISSRWSTAAAPAAFVHASSRYLDPIAFLNTWLSRTCSRVRWHGRWPGGDEQLLPLPGEGKQPLSHYSVGQGPDVLLAGEGRPGRDHAGEEHQPSGEAPGRDSRVSIRVLGRAG